MLKTATSFETIEVILKEERRLTFRLNELLRRIFLQLALTTETVQQMLRIFD